MNIVEYNNKLAGKVADMWNKSGSNWGDELELRNADDVINAEENSGNLKLYLAMDKEEVVGYCSFSEYQHDSGASYLPTLNVRPDYHGLGVGKALILKTIEEAIKSSWPRFDLFTWTGNIKAMPLYKKCGFFYERKLTTVHLMNFIPFLYQTDAFKEYLKDIDWYMDSKRTIDMEYDGIQKNGFDYFRYDFENEKTKLAFEFEKTARGLRLIDTPDYRIEYTLDTNQPIQNQDLEVTFKIFNKSKKPLQVQLKGITNPFVENGINETIDVLDEVTIIKKVNIHEMFKPIDKMRTYPYVEVDVYINGLLANFRLGIEPKSPLEISLQVVDYHHFIGTKHTGYLELENNLSTKEEFTIDLPNTLIESNQLSICLDSKEKRSIEFNYTVLDTGFYDEQATISYQKTVFKRPIKEVVKGIDKSFTGQTYDNAYCVHGNYMAVYSKKDASVIYLNTYEPDSVKQDFSVPQIGMPYSLEFSNIQPMISFPNSYSMDITYESKAYKDTLAIIHLVNLNGILKINYELKNLGPRRTLGLAFGIWVETNDSYIPYQGKLLKTDEMSSLYVGHFDNDLIDENWIYHHKTSSALVWDKEENVYISEWQMKSSNSSIDLDTNQSYITKNYYITYAHPSVKALRKFAGNNLPREEMKLFEIDVNNGNPISDTEVSVHIKNHKKVMFNGTFEIDHLVSDLNQSMNVSPGLKTIHINSEEEKFSTDRLIFKTKGFVKTSQAADTYVIDNGMLQFKASIDYSDAITSLIYHGDEWIDSNYPTPSPRAWWGKFSGGISTRLGRMQDNVVLDERRTIDFINIHDNFNNLWTGLKSTVYFEKAEEYKGLILESYTLTLPGTPLVYTFSNLINKSGKRLVNQNFNRHNFLQCDNDPTRVVCRLKDTEQTCQVVGIEKTIKKLLSFKSTRETMLYIYNKENELEFDTQKQYTGVFSKNRVSIPDNDHKILAGEFYIFSTEELTKDSLTDLKNIQFNI